MPSILASAAPYHIISYGTLLGTTIWQSFIGGVTAYRVLPRPQFATLQEASFPIYFAMQTALPVILALTLPEERTAISSVPSSIAGVFHDDNFTSVLLPLALNFICGAANLLYLGPVTTKCMRERKHQETRDGKKSYDAGPHSPEMQTLNKRFATLHGLSSGTNLIGLGGTLWYACYLAGRMM